MPTRQPGKLLMYHVAVQGHGVASAKRPYSGLAGSVQGELGSWTACKDAITCLTSYSHAAL